MSEQAPYRYADMPSEASASPYRRLLAMALGSLVLMYLLMFVMVDSIEDVHPSLNQLYMAGLMTSAMVVLELLLMRRMYQDERANAVILAAASLVGLFFLASIREQIGIGDRQLLKSMIPHHSSAIHMCKQASPSDPELQDMCAMIITSQEQEIDRMEEMLAE